MTPFFIPSLAGGVHQAAAQANLISYLTGNGVSPFSSNLPMVSSSMPQSIILSQPQGASYVPMLPTMGPLVSGTLPNMGVSLSLPLSLPSTIVDITHSSQSASSPYASSASIDNHQMIMGIPSTANKSSNSTTTLVASKNISSSESSQHVIIRKPIIYKPSTTSSSPNAPVVVTTQESAISVKETAMNEALKELLATGHSSIETNALLTNKETTSSLLSSFKDDASSSSSSRLFNNNVFVNGCVTVPDGWRRVVIKPENTVVYISRTNHRCSSAAQLREYLSRDDACTCGLPHILPESHTSLLSLWMSLFCFDSNVASFVQKDDVNNINNSSLETPNTCFNCRTKVDLWDDKHQQPIPTKRMRFDENSPSSPVNNSSKQVDMEFSDDEDGDVNNISKSDSFSHSGVGIAAATLQPLMSIASSGQSTALTNSTATSFSFSSDTKPLQASGGIDSSSLAYLYGQNYIPSGNFATNPYATLLATSSMFLPGQAHHNLMPTYLHSPWHAASLLSPHLTATHPSLLLAGSMAGHSNLLTNTSPYSAGLQQSANLVNALLQQQRLQSALQLQQQLATYAAVQSHLSKASLSTPTTMTTENVTVSSSSSATLSAMTPDTSSASQSKAENNSNS